VTPSIWNYRGIENPGEDILGSANILTPLVLVRDPYHPPTPQEGTYVCGAYLIYIQHIMNTWGRIMHPVNIDEI
jgi:hypothetical protein